MKKIFVSAMLLIAMGLLSGRAVNAAYCGLATYQNAKTKVSSVSFARARKNCTQFENSEPSCAASSCCEPRLVKDIVYEKKQYTCYKTVCEKVTEQRLRN